MRHLCAGCRLPFNRQDAQLLCRFCDCGFQVGSFRARPCLTRYHSGCIIIGAPFTTHLMRAGGMTCPKDVATYEHYICEACIVWSILGRELTFRPADAVLIMLERARFVDLTHHWASGTLKNYQSKYRLIRDFGTDLDVPMLQPTALVRPPHGEAIKLMWAQERYSLFPLEWRQHNSPLVEPVKFGSIRGVRSAVSHFWIWDLLLTHPERLTLGYKDHPMLVEACSPTEEMAYTYFTDGMRRRIGDNPRPSAVLLLEHIVWFDRYYDREFAAAVTDDACIEA
jgi:hypothetical protein